ncbi:MAG: hypothetical protein LC804_18570 [Acidobacteria bacterium]|nr:hypothetical protein [Acidobacteriota bacterium]
MLSLKRPQGMDCLLRQCAVALGFNDRGYEDVVFGERLALQRLEVPLNINVGQLVFDRRRWRPPPRSLCILLWRGCPCSLTPRRGERFNLPARESDRANPR